MRRRAAALWLLAAACSVPLEGAPCGDNTNCPSGQACGYDRTCSEAAVACGVIICRSGEGSCNGSDAQACAAEGVCGVWQTSTCTPKQICDAGACKARYTLQIANPTAGTPCGVSGVTVDVTLTPGPNVQAPNGLTLVATSTGTSSTSMLSLTSSPGVTPAQYQGTYSPLLNLEEPVTLQAYADYQGSAETGSSGVVVAVDTLPPRITGVRLTCVTCRRDDVLTLGATVTDGHPGTVTATVDFPPTWSQAATLTPPASGNDWQGSLDLSGQSFPFYQAPGHASVTATDALGNQRTVASSDVTVTRLRFALPVEAAAPPVVTGPAVDTINRLLYVGGANGKVYVVDPVTQVPPTGWSVATAAIVAPPSLGASLWVGSQDGKVYAVDPVTGATIGSCTTPGQVVASPAIDTVSPETVYAGAVVGAAPSSGLVYAVRTAGCVDSTAYAAQKVAAALAIDSAKNVYAVSGSTLRSLRLVDLPPLRLLENWTAAVGPVEVAVGLDPGRAPGGFAWTADTNGNAAATGFSGVPLGGSPFPTAASPGAPVVDSAGNVVVGDAAGYVHKIVPGGAGWTSSSSLGGAAGSPLVLAGGDTAYIVPTSTGRLAALQNDGTILWSGQVASPGASLNDPNVVRLPGDPFWTAVFGSQDGTVYGVLVDGHLDTTSPWPKARHDSRNTGNVVTPLP